MKKYFVASYRLLNNSEKKKVIIFFWLTFCSLIFETLSIGAFYPLFSAFIIDDLNNKFPFIEIILDFFGLNYNPDKALFYASTFIIFAFFLKNIFLIYFLFWQSNFYKNIKVRIKSDLLKIYNYESYTFHLKNNSSNLIRNITFTSDQAITNISNCMMIIIESLIFFGLCVFLFFIQSKMIFFLLIAIGLPTVVFAPIIKNIVGKWGKWLVSIQGKSMKALFQSFSMIKEIKIFSKEEEFVNLYATEEKKFQNIFMKTTILKNLPRFFFEILALVSIIAYIYLKHQSSSASLTSLIPEIGILTVTALRVYPSINKIIFALNKLSQNYKAINIISSDLSKLKNYNEPINNQKILFNEVKLENIFFSYSDKKNNIINDLNFSIKKGEYVGIYGKSGSGKSTFLDILLGMFEPTSGRILLDNEKSNLCSSKWRNTIGYVPQVVNLIDENVIKNISFESQEDQIDYERFNKAINYSLLEDFIKGLPEKKFTHLGERGSKISGGEKQRIGIARALYKKSEILILDESTNSLDQKTKKVILENINNLRGEKTIISISHEMEVLKDCDKVFEMKNGKLVKI